MQQHSVAFPKLMAGDIVGRLGLGCSGRIGMVTLGNREPGVCSVADWSDYRLLFRGIKVGFLQEAHVLVKENYGQSMIRDGQRVKLRSR
ncbi:MAG TPA: hypothetical protein VMO47_17470 [Rhodothermales bacterium]|nr:hypothetical protein [Rhodothermales bacterium]